MLAAALPLPRLALVLLTVLATSRADGDERDTADSAPLREADELYRSGRTDDALSAYDQIHTDSLAAGDARAAFTAGYRAATVEHQRNRFQQASQRFRNIALEMPKHEKAAGAHLLAIFDLAQLAREQRKTPSNEYLELLNEHLQHWPDSSTAAQARLWLGALQESQDKWREAVASYQAAAREPTRAAEAVAALVRAYGRWIASQKRGPQREQTVTDAIEWLEQFIVQGGGQAKAWTPAMYEAALAAARLWLTEMPYGYMQAHDVVTKANEKAAGATPAWRSSMAVVEVAALARQGQVEQATKSLDNVTAGSSEELQILLNQLSQALPNATPDRRQQLARLQLRTVNMLRTHGEQSAALRMQLGLTRAHAHLELSQQAEANRVYDEMLTAFPNSAEVREEFAQLLTVSQAAPDRQKALGLWQELARRTKPGTERWFRATYGTARTQLLLGNALAAHQIVMRTQAAYPELGGSQMKAKFLALLKPAAKR